MHGTFQVFLGAFVIAVSLAEGTGFALAHGSTDTSASPPPRHGVQSGAVVTPGHQPRGLKIPDFDSSAGRRLFVSKGCVSCHAINGVGGEDAPAMDAHAMTEMMNPFDFAARMWNHAQGMIAAQNDELGGQIILTGQELANIIAFVHDDAMQKSFSKSELPESMRNGMGHGDGHSGGTMHRSDDPDKSHGTGHINNQPNPVN